MELDPKGVVVVLPVLNEVNNIAPLIGAVSRELADYPHVICVIDDGSSDGTVEEVLRAKEQGFRVHLIQRRKTHWGSQRGSALWAGMKWGIENTACSIFVEMDGDLSHRPEELRAGIAEITSDGADAVIASKYLPGSSVLGRTRGRHAISHLSSALTALLISKRIKDYSNGYRFYNRRAAVSILTHRIRYGSPIYLTEVVAVWLRSGLRVKEIATTYIGRNDGLSKLRWTDVIKASIALWEIAARYRLSKTAQREVAPPWTRSERVFFAAAASLILLLAWGYCFRTMRPINIDELGLYNPIYVFATTGHIGYPIHGFPDGMWVHPPTHYWIAGWLVRFGMSPLDATALPLFALAILLVGLLATGGLSFVTAVSLLLGGFAGVFVWNDFLTIRPDAHLTLAWFTGLVALETARRRDWNRWRLFLGAALVTFAATLHYWGILAPFAIVVYAFVGVRSEDAPGRRVLLPLVLGCLVPSVPFLFAFVVPHYKNIISITSAVQGTGGPAEALAKHFQAYKAFLARQGGFPWTPRPLLDLVLRVVWIPRIPAVAAGFVLLALRRETRVFAAAAAVVPAFVLLASQGKATYGFTGYYAPENVLYLTAVFGTVLAAACSGVRQLVPPSRMRNLWSLLPATLLVLGVVTARPVSMESWRWTKDRAVMEVSRAAALQIVGPHAVVGTISVADWYTGGGHLLWSAQEQLMRLNREGGPVAEFVKDVDALVIDGQTWWGGGAFDGVPLAWWYAKRELALRGFVVHGGLNAHLTQLLVGSTSSHPMTGFIVGDREVWRFTEDSRGNFGVAVLKCSFRPPVPPGVSASAVFALKSAPRPDRPHLAVLCANTEDLDAGIRGLAGRCLVRDRYVGALSAVSRDGLLQQLRAVDAPMKFFSTMEDALAAKSREHAGILRDPREETNPHWVVAVAEQPAIKGHPDRATAGRPSF